MAKLANIVLTTAILLGPSAAYAHGSGGLSHGSGTLLRLPGTAPMAHTLAKTGSRADPATSATSNTAMKPATSALPLNPDGTCCSNLTVVPTDTPMRQPVVPTAPGMPGQPAPIGMNSTLPATTPSASADITGSIPGVTPPPADATSTSAASTAD